MPAKNERAGRADAVLGEAGGRLFHPSGGCRRRTKAPHAGGAQGSSEPPPAATYRGRSVIGIPRRHLLGPVVHLPRPLGSRTESQTEIHHR